MAVIDGCEWLTAEIIVDNVALQEHVDDAHGNHPGSTVVYVETNRETRFAVHCTVPKGFAPDTQGLIFELHGDGTRLGTWNYDAEYYRSRELRIELDYVTKWYDDHTVREFFKFSTHVMDEGGEAPDAASMEQAQSLGEITLRIYAAKKEYRTLHPSRRTRLEPLPATSDKPTPEKLLKGRAVTYSVSANNVVTDHQPSHAAPCAYKYTRIGGIPPLATFTFRYRSHDDLVKSGIIEEPDLIDTMTPEQLRALVRRQRIQINDDDDEKVLIKRRIAKLQKSAAPSRELKSGEIIESRSPVTIRHRTCHRSRSQAIATTMML